MTPAQYAKIVRLGNKAEELLNDEIFRELILDLREHTIRLWGETILDQTTAREALWHNVRSFDLFKQHLADLVGARNMENIKLERQDGHR